MSPVTWPDGRVPVLLTAHARELVAADAAAIGRYLEHRPGVGVADVAGHLLRTRRIRRHRAVLRAADRDELLEGLRAVAADEEHPLVSRSAAHAAPRLAFVCPGQGGQWPAMGADAYTHLPAYRAEADRCAAAFTAAGLASPLHYLRTAADPEQFDEVEVQGAQFIHSVALAAVWRSCGVAADLTVGHSLGEVAAAYIAGAITLSDAVAVIGRRAAVTGRMAGRYALAVLGVTPTAADQLIAETPGWLELSVINSGSSVVVSGDRDAVSAVVTAVADRGQFCREIAVNFPAHSSALEPLRDEFTSGLPASQFTDGPMQFIGSATGDVVPDDTDFVEYWYANLRNTVRFDRAVLSAVRCGAEAFVELSAHPTLLFAMSDVLGDAAGLPAGPAALVGSGHRDTPLVDELSAGIAAVAVTDARHRWGDVVGETPVLRGFPNAPMRRSHIWAPPEQGVHAIAPAGPSTPPAETPLTICAETWSPQTLPAPASTPSRTVAVLDYQPTRTVSGQLRAAMDRHPALSETTPDQADILVVVAPALTPTDAVEVTHELTRIVAAGVLDYAAAGGPRCRDIWLVTAGGERVVADDPAPLPGPAALAAMHRSIGFEHPDQTFRHVDIATESLDEATADAVVASLFTDAGEVAVRGAVPTLYRRDLSRSAETAPAWALDSGLLDDVVITGGTGLVGLHYARYFAERGARRIVLLGRRGADDDLLASVAGSSGAEIVAPPCDLSDRDQVSATAAEFAGAGASLVVHAAGTAAFATRDRLDEAVMTAAFSAKVVGFSHVSELWKLRPDARIVLCSSVSSVWGGQGSAAYTAANRILDVTAARMRAAGRACVSVRWGLWSSVAAGGIADAAETALIEMSGLRSMSPRPAIEASLREYLTDPMVYSADADRLRLFLTSQHATQPDPGADSDGGADTRHAVRVELASVLSVPDAASLDLDASLFDLGMDSLLALDLRKRIQRATGRSIPLARLLGGITGAELIAHLDQPGEQPATPRK